MSDETVYTEPVVPVESEPFESAPVEPPAPPIFYSSNSPS